MAIEVAKVELKNVQDASGVEACIRNGQFKADEVIAVIGKTEGNGGVNDFTRILADQAFRAVLRKHGSRSEQEIAKIPMVWSGGCDGVITPHATVFARNAKTGPAGKSRLVIGTAMSAEILPEDIGRPAMVEKVAEGVRAAMRDAGIDDPADVHYVQTKTPLLTVDTVLEAQARGKHVACEVHDSMGVSNGTTGLGIAVGLSEIKMPKAEEICRNLDLYSVGRLLLVGRRTDAGADRSSRQQERRRRPLSHRPFGDEGRARHRRHLRVRSAMPGSICRTRPARRRPQGRLVNCFMKCEADRTGKLRGRRQIMLDDSDVSWHRHVKAAVGGVAAAAIGDPAVFVSVDAMHQGPQGGGPASPSSTRANDARTPNAVCLSTLRTLVREIDLPCLMISHVRQSSDTQIGA